MTEKGNERYKDEFPDKETSYLMSTVFLTANVINFKAQYKYEE